MKPALFRTGLKSNSFADASFHLRIMRNRLCAFVLTATTAAFAVWGQEQPAPDTSTNPSPATSNLSPKERAKAARALKDSGADSLPLLKPMLADSDQDVRL